MALISEWEMGGGENEEVTAYRCRVHNLRHGEVTGKGVLCARRYKRLTGLYDVVFRFAALGRPHAGLLSTLTLSGVSFDNAQAVIRRFVEGIAWSE